MHVQMRHLEPVLVKILLSCGLYIYNYSQFVNSLLAVSYIYTRLKPAASSISYTLAISNNTGRFYVYKAALQPSLSLYPISLCLTFKVCVHCLVQRVSSIHIERDRRRELGHSTGHDFVFCLLLVF